MAFVERSTVGPLPYRVLYLAEADDVQEAVAQRQIKKSSGSTQRRDPVAYAALYTEAVPTARQQIVAELRARYQPSGINLPSSLRRHLRASHEQRAVARPYTVGA